MIVTAAQQPPFVELYDVAPAVAEFLAAFFGIALPRDKREPFIAPAVRRGVTWDAYESLLAATSERLIRHSIAGGTLELMSPRVFERENTKAALRRFVQTLTFETKQAVVTLGTATLASPSRCLGIEPDETFCFRRRVQFESGLYVDTDVAGPPDLGIEVGRLQRQDSIARVSAVEVDRLDLLARLGVREVWFVDRGHVEILHNRDQRLHAADSSQFLPAVTSLMLTRHLRNRRRIGENACITEFVAEALTN